MSKQTVVVVDISLPDGDGLEIVRAAKRDSPETRILVLTMYAQRELADAAFRAGADGYLLKESSARQLVASLCSIGSGEQVIDSRLTLDNTQQVADSSWERLTGETVDGRPLTDRELEVFRLLAVGRSAKEIGVELGISPKTVDNHRASILQKTDCASVADLVRLAIRTGVVQP